MIRRTHVTNIRSTNQSRNENNGLGLSGTPALPHGRDIQPAGGKLSSIDMKGTKKWKDAQNANIFNYSVLALFAVIVFMTYNSKQLIKSDIGIQSRPVANIRNSVTIPQNRATNGKPSFVRVPAVVTYNHIDNNASERKGTTARIFEDDKDTVGLDQLLDLTEDPPDESTCQPMHKWQTENYPQCIRMHEIDMMPRPGSLVFINCGGDRCAWMLVDETDGTKLTLKTQKYRKEFYSNTFENARKDGLVMERLTKSQYIASTYGYCGLSQLVEYSQGGNIHDLVKTTRIRKNDLQTPLERLKVGIQVANAVADLHTFENNNITSVTHGDLCCHQFILIDGIYKLNDFHMAKFLKSNKKNHETCKESARFNTRYALVHSPEESNIRRFSVEKADVFSMGNVMYYVLTKKWLFEIGGESVGAAMKKLIGGERSPFPENLQNSKNPADKALIEGIELAWIHDASKRPRAREIADIMIRRLEKIEGRKYVGPDSIRVSIPPLPQDYRYSDSDFEANLG